MRRNRNLVDLIVRDRTGKLVYWTTREHNAKTTRGLDRVHNRLMWELFGQFPNAATVTIKEV